MGLVASVRCADATRWGNASKIDTTTNGVLWCLVVDQSASTGNYSWSLKYTQDSGVNWSAITLPFGTSQPSDPAPSLRVGSDDSLNIAFTSQNGYMQFVRGVPTNSARTSYTWSNILDVHQNPNTGHPDLAIAKNPHNSGWTVGLVHDWVSGTAIRVRLSTISIAADNTLALWTTQDLGAYQMNNGQLTAFPSIDLRHTGDGKTASAQPDFYAGWAIGSQEYGVYFCRITYADGSWGAGPTTNIDSSHYNVDGSIQCFFDGTRPVVVNYGPGGPSYGCFAYDIDTSNNPTRYDLLVSPAAADALRYGSFTYDSAGNIYIFGAQNGQGNGTSAVGYRKWTRSSQSLGSRVNLTTSGRETPYVSLRRGGSGSALDCVYVDGFNPTSVVHTRIQLNSPPNSAIANSPTNRQRVDRTQPIPCSWQFSDPDAGDSQSRADFRYRVGTGAWTTITNAASTAQSYSIPANTFAAEATFGWQVLPSDSQGVPAPDWSAESFAVAADPTQAPTMVAPTSGGTIASSSYLVQWSSANQDAYELRRVADNAGAPTTGTRYYESGTVEDATSRSRVVAFETNNRVEHVQVRVRKGGLWSPWASVKAIVSFTPPAPPTLAIAAVRTRADWSGLDAIDVAITNPAPSNGQPTVVSHDVLVDDGTVEGLRRVATGLAPGTTWRHWTPVAGRDYAGGRIRVVAVAANGTTSTASS